MRRSDPERPRPFKTPLVPLVPLLGILVCTSMIVGLPGETLLIAFLWMIIGLVIYFGYSRHRSNLQSPKGVLPTASDFEKH
jgi:APA family basic amino acid/polyamine antiporter